MVSLPQSPRAHPLFSKHRTTDQEQILYYLDDTRDFLRAACGALLVAKRRHAHGGAQVWLDIAEEILARLEDLRRSVDESQGWTEGPP
jgi:hypothetical protein